MNAPKMRGLCLHLSHHTTANGLPYQRLEIELTRRDRLIYPEELAAIALPARIDTTCGVVISGRGPIWLHGYLLHELHPTAWVGFYEPRLNAAIVASTHCRTVKVGEVIPLAVTESNPLAAALMIVGPPDSGKSVLAHTLFCALLEFTPDIYLQRANWDGEGNYLLEMPASEDEQEQYKARNKGAIAPHFFPYHAQAILQLRRHKSLVLVDVGGMVQPEKQPILEACTHYLIISSNAEAIEPWHEFCRDRGNLSPVAVIHSSLDDCAIVHREQPYLEMTCGPWIRGQKRALPPLLLAHIQRLLQ
jgi:CRISPR-associated protein Csx3